MDFTKRAHYFLGQEGETKGMQGANLPVFKLGNVSRYVSYRELCIAIRIVRQAYRCSPNWYHSQKAEKTLDSFLSCRNGGFYEMRCPA